MSDIGHAIKTIRKHRKLTQCDLAKRVGVTQAYLSQIEYGKKKPSLDVLETIAEKLQAPLPVLLWFSCTERDVQFHKLRAYRELKPTLDGIIKNILL